MADAAGRRFKLIPPRNPDTNWATEKMVHASLFLASPARASPGGRLLRPARRWTLKGPS